MALSRSRWILAMLAAMLGTAGLTLLATRPRASAAQEELDRQFEQMLDGATLVGQSTTTGREGLSGEERYVIESVTRLSGHTWFVKSRFKYATHDVPILIPVQVHWAGDTPVLGLTDFRIPGMGTFSARVAFYRDQYAGAWSAEKYGGQLFGRLERPR